MWLMWQSATPATVAMLPEQHLFIGGLGGVIAVVGGVISVITLRATRRSTRPAVLPRAAEPDRPASSRPAYGEPAPPTSPARRLHPGPVSLSAPTRPDGPDDDHPHISTSLFDPDLHGAGPSEPEPETLAELRGAPPVLRPSSHFSAAWRAQVTPAQESEPAHAPIWQRSSFLQPGDGARVALDGVSAPASDLMSAPPIWRTAGASALFGVSSPTEAQAPTHADPAAPTEEAAHIATSAPIWSSWLRPRAADPSVARLDERNGAIVESEPPIWPSPLLKPE